MGLLTWAITHTPQWLTGEIVLFKPTGERFRIGNAAFPSLQREISIHVEASTIDQPADLVFTTTGTAVHSAVTGGAGADTH
jgi:hypothetical protein